MGKYQVVHVHASLVDGLKKEAKRRMVKIGTLVNDILRQELTGERSAAPVAVAAPVDAVCKTCKGTQRVPKFLGCKENENHLDRWKFYGERGACDICHDCFDPDGVDPDSMDLTQEPYDPNP